MVNHVKLEIALQIASENIANIFKRIDLANSEEEKFVLQGQLDYAFAQQKRVSLGDMKAVNEVLNERRKKNGR